jgi:hypothetical protein
MPEFYTNSHISPTQTNQRHPSGRTGQNKAAPCNQYERMPIFTFSPEMTKNPQKLEMNIPLKLGKHGKSTILSGHETHECYTHVPDVPLRNSGPPSRNKRRTSHSDNRREARHHLEPQHDSVDRLGPRHVRNVS